MICGPTLKISSQCGDCLKQRSFSCSANKLIDKMVKVNEHRRVTPVIRNTIGQNPIQLLDPFVASLRHNLQLAVFKKNLNAEEVFEHFAGEEKRVDQDAISRGAKTLGIIPTKEGVQNLWDLLEKDPSDYITENDIKRLIYGFERYSPVMEKVDKNCRILKGLGGDEKAKNAWESWYNDRSIDAEEINIPVENILLIKKIEEGPHKELYLCGTIIQVIIGLTPRDEAGNLITFGYRINEMKPSEKFLCKRRSIISKDENGVKYVKTTFSVKIKLEKFPVYVSDSFFGLQSMMFLFLIFHFSITTEDWVSFSDL